MFSANAVSGYTPRKFGWIERVIAPVTVLPLFADAAGCRSSIVIALATVAFGAHLMRVLGWKSYAVHGPAILAVLHRAYAWIPLGFGLLALSRLGLVPHTIAVHALTFGAIGGAIIAMITRTARGHTGLPLQADRKDVVAYNLVLAGGVLRVFGPLAMASHAPQWVLAAGICWCAAFIIYLVGYAPRLCRPRADGKPG